MTAKNILLVGCGDIGIPLGLELQRVGHSVFGLRRQIQALPLAITGISANVTDSNSLKVLQAKEFDIVVVTLTPSAYNDDGYRRTYVDGLANLLANLSGTPHIIYISSTSVFHQNNGDWVDEDSDTQPASYSGKRLLEAEQLLMQSDFNHTIVRFSGIYGPGRQRLIDQVKNLQGCIKQPPLFTNRIHRDDCVGFLFHLINLLIEGARLDPLYLATDSEPATMWDVKAWLATQLGIDPETLTEEVTTRRSSKRLSNKKMLATGYCLEYKNFREGYKAVLDSYD